MVPRHLFFRSGILSCENKKLPTVKDISLQLDIDFTNLNNISVIRLKAAALPPSDSEN